MFKPYPVNTYTLKELAQMYRVSYITMSAMIKEVETVAGPKDGKKFRKTFYPIEVEAIFNKFGTPQVED